MKFIFTGLCLFLFLSAQAQTKYIAFKSHSGDMDFFLPDAQPEDDFGLPPASMTRIKKINDSTVVEYAREYGSDYEMTDTVVNQIYCKNPNIDLDSLKKIYPDVQFEGFDNKTSKTEKKETLKEEKKELKKEKKQRKEKKAEEMEDKAEVLTIPVNNKSNGGNAPLFIVMCVSYVLVIISIAAMLLKGKRNSIA